MIVPTRSAEEAYVAAKSEGLREGTVEQMIRAIVRFQEGVELPRSAP